MNVIDSNSYVFLGKGATTRDSAQVTIIGRSSAKTNLMRDDFLIFELTFHSQEKDNQEDENVMNRKTKIRDPSDYSIRYHDWTLRQLYRHVVSSIKIHHSSATASAAAAGSAGDSASSSHTRRRSRSISENFAPAFASPPPPTNNHHRRSISTGSNSSRHHRQNSTTGSGSNNNHHHPQKLLGSNLHPRDMRRLVTPFSASNEPELIVRRHVMVFNFDPLRAIITRDRLLVLVPNGADSILKNLEERIVGSCLEYDGYTDETEFENENQNENWKGNGRSEETTRLSDLEEGVAEDDGREESDKGDEALKGEALNEDKDENDTDDDDWSEMMMMEMEGEQNDLTFELLCVNACLSTVFEMLADDTRELQDKGLKCIQDRVICDIRGRGRNNNNGKKQPQQRPLKPEDALAVIRNLKNAVKVMQARVKGFVHSINRILNEDEDMALMNLSRLVSHPENFVQPISQEMLEAESDEPELVLESNLHNALTLSNALDLIQGQVDTASDLIDARMDAARNKFLLATLCISIASLSLSAISCVSSIFGMNLANPWDEDGHPTKFYEVTFGSIAGSLVLGTAILAGMILTGVITGIGPVDQDGIDTLF